MNSNQAGMSLVEVMLACALGLFLIFGFIQIYLAVQKTTSLQEAVVNMQENGRFAGHFLSESIRMAGYAHCNSSTSFVNVDLAIRGYRNNPPQFLADVIKKNTDSLEVGECVVRDQKEKFEQFVFFVGPTQRKDKLGNTIFALYVKSRVAGNKRELVTGVENLKIQYGMVTNEADKNISSYLSADSMTEKAWKKVRAVKLALLLRSEQPVFAQPQAYEFWGERLLADRFLHREWDIYVALREL